MINFARLSFKGSYDEYCRVFLPKKIELLSFLRFQKTLGLGLLLTLSASENGGAAAQGPDYNLLLGPVALRASASLTGTYNDNISASNINKMADFIVIPQALLRGSWQVTEANALTFDIGLGYQFYMIHTEDSGVIITPDSQASFKFSLGEVQFILADAVSYQQDPTLVGQLSNTTNFPTLTNTASINTSWDATPDVTLSATYGHTTQKVFDSTFNDLSYELDSISPRVSYKITDTINAGLTGVVSETRYDKRVQNDNVSVQVGPFVSAQFSSNLSVYAQAAYISTTYDTGGSNGDTGGDINSYTGSLGITHQINEAFTQSLSAGKDYLPGLTSNYTDRLYANYTLSWAATAILSLAANVSAENLVDSEATISQTSNRILGGVNAYYVLSTHATLNLSYQYILKDSNISNLSYSQNRITAGCQYEF